MGRGWGGRWREGGSHPCRAPNVPPQAKAVPGQRGEKGMTTRRLLVFLASSHAVHRPLAPAETRSSCLSVCSIVFRVAQRREQQTGDSTPEATELHGVREGFAFGRWRFHRPISKGHDECVGARPEVEVRSGLALTRSERSRTGPRVPGAHDPAQEAPAHVFTKQGEPPYGEGKTR